MKGMNKVILIGNLGKDPEIRHTQGGSSVANVSLAINERRKKGDAWEDYVEWVNLVAFGKTADVFSQYTSKGSPVAVEGRIQTRKWKDKDGNTRYSTEVVVNDLVLLGSGKGQAEKPRSNRPSDNLGGGDDPFASSANMPFDPNDDVPF